MTALITTFARLIFVTPSIAGLLEVFLYSILHAYYCFEFKTTIMDLDFLSSIAYFEAQWAYQFGFGFLFTMVLYLFKQVGSSLFFLFFPLMVVISLEEGGQGLLAYDEKRVTKSITLPLFTMAYYPHRWILRKIN